MREPFGDQPFADAVLRYAPDGSKLAIWARTWQLGTPFPSLWIIPTDGRAPYRVKGIPDDVSPINLTQFDWLADSRRIVAAMERSTAQGVHLWIFMLKMAGPRPSRQGRAKTNTPAVSPDGHRIAYASQDTNFDLVEVPLDGSPLTAAARDEPQRAGTKLVAHERRVCVCDRPQRKRGDSAAEQRRQLGALSRRERQLL